MGSKFAFGDINGDGFKDCLIGGGTEFSMGQKVNMFYILYGRRTFPDFIPLEEGSPYLTTVKGCKFFSVGDINGDGYDDILCNGDEQIYIILGRGKTQRLYETIIKELPGNGEIKSNFHFSNGIDFHFKLIEGRPYINAKLYLTNYGNHLPDSLQSIPTTKNVLVFLKIELLSMIYSYKIQGSVGYTDSALTASGMKEQNLVISCWNENKSKWEKLPTTIDTTLNRATFEVEHLSLFALTVKNDSIMTDIKEINTQIPLSFELYMNYPNPFNPSTTIRFQIPMSTNVKIKIYNILGREVKTIISEQLSAGTHEVKWGGTDNFGNKVASGIYIYRMETNSGYVKTRKMVYLK